MSVVRLVNEITKPLMRKYYIISASDTNRCIGTFEGTEKQFWRLFDQVDISLLSEKKDTAFYYTFTRKKF